MQRPLALAALLLSVPLAGCTFEDPDVSLRKAREPNLPYYNVIMHPPNLHWEEANQTLSGNITLSAIQPNYRSALDEHDIWITSDVVYFSNSPFAPYGQEGRLETWSPSYNGYPNPPVVISEGDTFVFEFEIRPEKPFPASVRAISFFFRYSYSIAEIEEDGSIKRKYIAVFYENRCLEIVDGRLRQSDGASCLPYDEARDGYTVRFSNYEFSISGFLCPPVELWNNWPGIHPQLVRVLDYLNSYTPQNVTRFRDT